MQREHGNAESSPLVRTRSRIHVFAHLPLTPGPQHAESYGPGADVSALSPAPGRYRTMRWPNFFRPAWQHPDPERRLAAITTQALEPAQLRELAVGDPDHAVQLAAVAQLVKRGETATLEAIALELAPEHPAREHMHAYFAAHHAMQWKRALSSSAKLEVLRSLPRVQLLLPYVPLVDTIEQATLVEQRLASDPHVEVVCAVLAASAFPTAVKDRLVQVLPKEVLTTLLSSLDAPTGLSKKWRQRVEQLLGKDSAAEARAQETAAELTGMHDRLVRALAETNDEHPKHLRTKFSLAAWMKLDPKKQHPEAHAYQDALASLEHRIATLETCERQITEEMEAVLAASADPTWDSADNGPRNFAAFETRLDELVVQLPKALAQTVQKRRDVVRSAVTRAVEQRRAEAEQARLEAEREHQHAQRDQQRQQEREQDEKQRTQHEDRERVANRSLQQRLDELMAHAEALQAPEFPPDQRTARLRTLRAQWENLRGPGEGALKQARDEQFRAALAAADELCLQAEEDQEWRRWADLQNLDKMTVRAQALLTVEDVTEVAKGLRTLRLQWMEMARQGVGADGAQHVRRFQEAWDRAFERVHAAQEQCLAALTTLTSAETPPSVAEIKILQDAFRTVDVPAGPQQRGVEMAFRRAIDGFFAKLRQQHEEQRQAREQNLEARRGLIAEAERILADQAARDQGSRLIELQRRWKEIGPVPRELAEATWKQFHALCQSFFDKQRDERNQAVADREALSKEMQAILDTLGDESGSAFEQRTTEVESLIARWQSAVVTNAQREPLESTFRELTKRFYDGVRRGQESRREVASKAVVRKFELVEEAELLAEGATGPDVLARLQEIERVWGELPGAAKAQETLLLARLRAAVARYARVENGAEVLSADLAANLTKKRAVCGKLAILHKLWSPTAAHVDAEFGDLGRQLQLALSLKNAVSVPGDTEATRRRILREVGEAVREWEAAGAVAAEQRPVLMQQFQLTMRGFAE